VNTVSIDNIQRKKNVKEKSAPICSRKILEGAPHLEKVQHCVGVILPR
jgi:hypothetical protein